MAKLTSEVLNRYVDGDLSVSETARVEQVLATSPDDRQALQQLERVGAMVRLMDGESTKGVSFEGLSGKVLAEIKTTRSSLPWSEGLRTWFSEFFAHGKPVWVPAAAVVTVACAALLVVPLLGAPTSGQGGDSGIVLHSASAGASGSHIAAVDFGGASCRFVMIRAALSASRSLMPQPFPRSRW